MIFIIATADKNLGEKMTIQIEQRIFDALDQSIRVKQNFITSHIKAITYAGKKMAETLQAKGKILLFGNGGSAADAQHIAAEFVNRFQMERPPLAAIALTTDTSIITSIGNDYSFEDIFYKQVQALGRKGDVVIAISTSGNSPNVIKAARKAKDMELSVIGMSGNKGILKEIADTSFCVNSSSTARIQESHIFLGHLLCDITENLLFKQ